jgi:ureidoacrylate peracid hydrolase
MTRAIEWNDLKEILRPSSTAVMVVDVQNDFCHSDGVFAQTGADMAPIQSMIPTLAAFIDNARDAGVMIVWIKQSTLPDGRSDSPAWRAFKSRDGKNPEYTLAGSWGEEFVDALKVRDGEPVIRKYRSSSFINTGLDLVLRSSGIRTVVTTGVMSHGCVESTSRDASYHDYFVVPAEDCMQSTNQKLHEYGLATMRHYFHVLRSSEIIQEMTA